MLSVWRKEKNPSNTKCDIKKTLITVSLKATAEYSSRIWNDSVANQCRKLQVRLLMLKYKVTHKVAYPAGITFLPALSSKHKRQNA